MRAWWTTPSRPTSRLTAAWRSPRCRTARETSSGRPADERDHQPHQGRLRRSAPTWSPDGKSIVYIARVSGNEKLFRLDIGDRQEDAAHVRDPRRRLGAVPRCRHAGLPVHGHRSRTADRSGRGAERQIYNIWTLNLKTGELRQYTDAVGGNISTPSSSRTATAPAEDRLHQLLQGRVRAARARPPRSDRHRGLVGLRSTPGPIIDFQAPLSHTLDARQERRRGSSRRCSSTAVRR